MKIESSFAQVTGANHGISLAFARELLASGAGKVEVVDIRALYTPGPKG